MKNHKKTYENVYSSDIKYKNVKLREEQVTVKDMELGTYTDLFRNFLNDFYSSLFLNCVKLSWLRRKFTYYGIKAKLPMNKNPIILNSAFVKYLRRYIGKDIQLITRGKFFSRVETYFDDMFPGFEDGDPFTNPNYYKFPFKYISMDYLMVVYQLDDRMELLKKAEDKKMSYAVFLDYVINHVYSENDCLNRNRYQIKANKDRNFSFYVIDLDKKLMNNNYE